MKGVSPLQALNTAATIGLLIAGAYIGYRMIRADLVADVYRSRLDTLAKDYDSLRSIYNQAVARTAVTELVVKEGVLSVRVRNAEGVLREISTPYDPRGEIYVDYVVLDGRLWIRRVFDAKTAPSEGLVIDPALANVRFDASPGTVGKAVYRSLSEGRWVVTVTGDGSLGLARARDEGVELAAAPAVRDHEQISGDAKRAAQAIGGGDIWNWLVR